jgi:hypothetical protein
VGGAERKGGPVLGFDVKQSIVDVLPIVCVCLSYSPRGVGLGCPKQFYKSIGALRLVKIHVL